MLEDFTLTVEPDALVSLLDSTALIARSFRSTVTRCADRQNGVHNAGQD